MANMSQMVLEISSDEEVHFGDIRKDENGCGELGERDDHDWLTKLLVEVDEKEGNELVDVVLVNEVMPKKPNLQVSNGVVSNLEASKPVTEPLCGIIDLTSDSDDDCDDDDCVVLDGDPDKPVLLLGNGDDGSKGGNDSDEVEVVGEKGEVACRDFPHSRHLCVKFIFSSTLHQNHCSQCHCYVCDSLAPCLNWGTGMSSTDHCHASDKDEYWKTERKRKKTGDDKPMPVTIKSFLTQRRQSTQAAVQMPIPGLPSQSLRPAAVQPCSESTNVIPPGVVNPAMGIAPGSITPRSSNGIAPRVVKPFIGIPQQHTTSNVTAPRIVNPSTGISQGHIPPNSYSLTMPRIVNPSTGIAQGHVARSSSFARMRVVNPSTGVITQGNATPISSRVPRTVNPSRGHITPRSSNVTIPHVVNPSTGITQGHATPRSFNTAPTPANSTGIALGHVTPRSNGIASNVVNPSMGIAQGHVTSSSSNVITPGVSNPSTGNAQGNTIPGYKRKLQTVSPLHVNSLGGNNNIEKTSRPFLSPPATWSGYGNDYSQSQSSRPYLKRCRTLPTSISNGSYVSNQQTTVSHGLANPSAPPVRPQLNPEAIPTQLVRSTSGPQIPSQQYVNGTLGNGLPFQSSMGASDNVINSQPNSTVQTNSSLQFKAAVSNQSTCSLPSETNVYYQTNIGNNTPPSQLQASTVASSHPSTSNTYDNQSSQSHAYNNLISLPAADKNGFLVTSTENFDRELEAFLRGGDVQASIDTSPPDNNQCLSVPNGAHDQNSASKDTFQQQSVVAPDSSLSSGVTDCFQFERPMFENRSHPDTFAGPVSSPLWNEFSHDRF